MEGRGGGGGVKFASISLGSVAANVGCVHNQVYVQKYKLRHGVFGACKGQVREWSKLFFLDWIFNDKFAHLHITGTGN